MGDAVMVVRSILCAMLLCASSGCQTVRSWYHGCPGVYSGVRFFGDQLDWLPFDGKVFFSVDLPFSAVADTLSLPVTFFVSPERPKEGYVRGCRWAENQ